MNAGQSPIKAAVANPPILGSNPTSVDAIRKLAAEGRKEVVVAPIGFVCDHVEVLYDLDIEAKKIAEDHGVTMRRASCPNDHPTFIRMMANVIERKLKTAEDRG